MIDTYLAITLQIDPSNRSAACDVYMKYKVPFLTEVPGALSKELLVRTDDVQVLHKFSSKETATGYLGSTLFTSDVVRALRPYLLADPDVRVYEIFKD